MSRSIDKLFLDHPHSVDETYIEHAGVAFGFSMKLFVAAFAALIHAILPGMFEKTASKIICGLYQRMNNR